MMVRHKVLHNNSLFYSLTPALAPAIARAFSLSTLPDAGSAFYEFGTFKGFSLFFVERMNPEIMVFGFDSFKGMPFSKGAHPHHAKGQYRATVEEVRKHLASCGCDMQRIGLIQTWFTDERMEYLSDALKKQWKPVKVAVIDCDLYVSTVPVLEFLRPLLVAGSILIFDDYKMAEPSEKTAFDRFLAVYPSIVVKVLFDYGIYGRVFRIEAIG